MFWALSKYSRTKAEENSLTEAFAFIIKYLWDNERNICLSILKQLFLDPNDDSSFNANRRVLISTQCPTEAGPIDIKIEDKNRIIIYIENKDWSTQNRIQLGSYRDDLDSKKGYTIKRLVSLTRFPIDITRFYDLIHNQITWHEVKNVLEFIKLETDVGQYLTSEFCKFLEELMVTQEKPDKEVIDIIQDVCVSSDLRWHLGFAKAKKENNKGDPQKRYPPFDGAFIWNKENHQFFCGTNHNSPHTLQYCTEGKRTWENYIFNPEIANELQVESGYEVTNEGPPYGKDIGSISFLFRMDEIFYAMSKCDKSKTITGFIKKASTGMLRFKR